MEKIALLDEQSIKVVSAPLGVDHRKVAAVRIETAKKEWVAEVCVH